MKNLSLFISCLLALTLFNTSCKNNSLPAKTESKYYTDSLYSNHLQEFRKHNIYLPQNFTEADSAADAWNEYEIPE